MAETLQHLLTSASERGKTCQQWQLPPSFYPLLLSLLWERKPLWSQLTREPTSLFPDKFRDCCLRMDELLPQLICWATLISRNVLGTSGLSIMEQHWLALARLLQRQAAPFFHACCLSTAHSSDSTLTAPRLRYKPCKNIRLLHWCDKSPHWQQQLKAEVKHWLCWATEKQNLPPSVAVAEPNRWLLQEGSHVLQAADSCSFSGKEDVAHSLSNPTAASPPLHLCWPPAGQQSGAFLAVTSHLIFFFAFSQSQDTVRNVNGFCFFMLSPHVLLFSEAKWNGSAFSWSPKVLSTGMQEKMQLFSRAGRAELRLHTCSDPKPG